MVTRENDARTPEGRRVIEMLDNPQTARDVETWAKVGMSRTMIAAKLGITPGLFKKHFEDKFERGRFDSVLAMRAKLFEIAIKTKGHAAIIAWLRSIGDVADRVEVTGEGGGPIRTVDLTPVLEKMTDEQLSLIGPILDRLIGAGGGDPDRTIN